MNNELTIEQKMEYVRKALEMGADIDLIFHNFRDKDTAEKAAKDLSEFIHIPYLQKFNQGTSWFKIRTEDCSVGTLIFFDEEEQREAM